MVNIKLVSYKLKKMPGLFRNLRHQITHHSTLEVCEDITQLFPNIFDNEIHLAKLVWRFGHVCNNESLIFYVFA